MLSFSSELISSCIIYLFLSNDKLIRYVSEINLRFNSKASKYHFFSLCLLDFFSLLLFSDLFGTLDPFGSSSFSNSSNNSAGFADFSHMLKPRDPFEGRASWLPDYQKVPMTLPPATTSSILAKVFPCLNKLHYN